MPLAKGTVFASLWLCLQTAFLKGWGKEMSIADTSSVITQSSKHKEQLKSHM